MPKEDTAIDPKPTISLMFAISVGFWASQLATYITPTSEIARLHTETEELQAGINNEVNTHVEDFEKKFLDRIIARELQPEIRSIQTAMQLEVRKTLRNYIKNPDSFIRSSAEDRQKQQEGTQEEVQTVPNESKPQAPSESEPQAPSESEPQAPSESEPQAPSESKPQGPNESKPQAPNESKPQAPNESKPQAPNEIKRPEVNLKSDIEGHLESYGEELKKVKSDLSDDADDLKKKIIGRLNKYVDRISPTNRKWQWRLTLVSGLLFLIDLLCILWWYARYIYRVQPKARFWTYFLDFVICSMFALAANSWTKPNTFLFASLCGSTFLIFRFTLLYFGSSASQTDKYILKMAGIGLFFAIPVVVACLSGVDKILHFYNSGIYIFGPSLPGLLSLIGIVLTICLKTKIDVAVAIYAARHAPIASAHLTWPESMLPGKEDEKGKQRDEKDQPKDKNVEKDNDKAKEHQKKINEQHARIRHRTRNGLNEFDNLFRLFRKHDRIYSRVHSETELRVQSYILALPSCENEECAEEIEKKSFMVAVSHWLDDLVDGRNELLVYEQLQQYKKLHSDPPLSDEKKHAKDLFSIIYRPLITKYTDRHFYDHMYYKICEACLLPFNQKYMLLGLNRVACGAVIFSPKLTLERRWSILTDHNNFLKLWNIEGPGKKFENAVEDLIDEISVGDEAGPILLGLTTKTVQELALSSERRELNVGMSILLSILYAPLIYYHDISEELENDEMVPLQAFDTDSDLWIPWLKKARNIIEESGPTQDKQLKKKIDERHEMRLKQIEMAYKCFEPKLPEHILPRLREIFLPNDTGN